MTAHATRRKAVDGGELVARTLKEFGVEVGFRAARGASRTRC